MKLEIEQFVCKSPFFENAYFVINPESKDFVVVDPGDGSSEKVSEYVNKGYNFSKILITHVHVDHTWDVPKLREKFPEIPIIMHEKDTFWAENYQLFQQTLGIGNYGDFPAIETVTFVNEGDKIKIGNEEMVVLHVPGHSVGHIAFYVGEAKIEFDETNMKVSGSSEGICFVGDVIFKRNVGRTDLPKGDGKTLVNSIKNKIFALPDETLLYNGHGEHTTVGFEKKFNFLVGEDADSNFIFP